MRIEPPMSEPVAIAEVPEASEAAEPPEEPPGVKSRVPRIAGDAPAACDQV